MGSARLPTESVESTPKVTEERRPVSTPAAWKKSRSRVMDQMPDGLAVVVR